MNFEYKTEHLEGISDNKPNETEIIKHAKNKGFELKEVEIWFDKFQLFWRFSAEYTNQWLVKNVKLIGLNNKK